jgi:hypothetical protein
MEIIRQQWINETNNAFLHLPDGTKEEQEELQSLLREIVEFTPDHFKDLGLSQTTINFLVRNGLPPTIGDFWLYLIVNTSGQLMNAYEHWHSGKELEHLKEFIIIGHNCTIINPKPILKPHPHPDQFEQLLCISSTTETVICLTYNNVFDELFINSSIEKFFLCALEEFKFINKIKNTYGETALINGEYSMTDLTRFKEALESIDKKALQLSTFYWSSILAHLQAACTDSSS